MQISSIRISNFKGLRDAEYKPSRFGCIVGENNSGKSTILQAITYALNRPPQLDESLYYDLSTPIVFRLAFDNVTLPHLARLEDTHRDRITPLINDEKLVLIIRYALGQKIDIAIESLRPIDDRYQQATIDEIFKGKRGAEVRTAIDEHFPEFADGSPESPNITQAKEYIAERMTELPADLFEMREGPLPTGIASSITRLLPDPIYIPAVKNINDDLKTSQSTSFGRLLGLLLEDMAPDLDNINDALSDLRAFFNRVEVEGEIEDNRHQKVKDLESDIEARLAENFPAVKVELEVPPPELKAILNSAQIFVDDGSKDSIENKGDGIKRSLTFALLQCYVNRLFGGPVAAGDGVAPRPNLFLFEEPELYLHPKSQRILFATLEKISHRFQVVVTTHSPLFFAPGITASFVRISKEHADPKPIGVIHDVNFDLDPASAEAFKLAKFENADAAFFSRRVVLFEGESDDAFFKHVSKKIDEEWDFDSQNIAMVQVSGKGNFAKFRRFFEAFGIQVKIVADLDAFFEGFQHLGADGVEDIRNMAIQTIDDRVATLNIPAEPKARQIKAKVKNESWQTRYADAKAAIRLAQENGNVPPEALETIDSLFVWEDDIARGEVCLIDDAARAALTPCIDALRAQGVCVLSKGAIEDYYPDEAPRNGPKPERALAAIQLVTTAEVARALSAPLVEGREPELAEICAELFADR